MKAAAAGYIGLDHRFLHAILDRPEASLPAIVQFTAQDHEDDPLEIDDLLVDLFRHLRAPEAVPFLVNLARRNPLDIQDDLVEAIVQFGGESVDPLLALLAELEAKGEDTGDVPFLLSQLGIRDERILNALLLKLEDDEWDAALLLGMYGDPAAIPSLEKALAGLDPSSTDAFRIKSYIQELSSPTRPAQAEAEKFDIWPMYPEKTSPPVDVLDEHTRIEMLRSGSSELKTDVAAFYRAHEFGDRARASLLDVARNDPDHHVRAECWETLGEIANEPEIRKALLAVLTSSEASVEERGGAAVGLATHSDNAKVFEAIERLYNDPHGRAKALKAMGRSFDKRFSEYPPRHLDDPDTEIKRQAIWATGYLNLQSEAPRIAKFFASEEFRADALFAYALSVPAETSPGRIQSLLNKIEDAAGGFKIDEEELVQIALDQRLILHGKKPVFSGDDEDFEDDEAESESEPAVSAKIGRNDPCPCGSGKKFKKCCGA